MSLGNGSSAETFEEELEGIGYRNQGSSRRGGRMWVLEFNSYLTFTVHGYEDDVLLTWSVALGELAADRGWMLGTGEASLHELYPREDVRLPPDADAVGRAMTGILGDLRLDLGDPGL